MRDGNQVQNVVEKTLSEFGRVDILVNNVGGSFASPFMKISERGWNSVLRLNLSTCFLCTQAVLKPMMEQRKGSIINISSNTGQVGTPGLAHYGAAKAGVINLTGSIASEFASFNIRANCIVSGPVATDAFGEKMMEDTKRAILSALAIKRFGTPQDIATAAIFLASDASEWVTGKAFEVDGGYRVTHSQV